MYRPLFFFFNAPPTTKIYTLSLHDALPIYMRKVMADALRRNMGLTTYQAVATELHGRIERGEFVRSEEHTSELQSRGHLVCRLLLEKKKKQDRKKRIK